MAVSWPAPSGIEDEGDREYIGPEILLGQYDKPADVFALGLIILEIAANVQLPGNGPSWMRLRSGDMSDAPSLTWSNNSALFRDATGIPLDDSDVIIESFGSDDEIATDFGTSASDYQKRNCGNSSRSLFHDPVNLFGATRGGELHRAPLFMRNRYNEHSLDKLVCRMISPAPQDRPSVREVLQSEGVEWVAARRRAGATVFEGYWGPADAVLADEVETNDA